MIRNNYFFNSNIYLKKAKYKKLASILKKLAKSSFFKSFISINTVE
jgi:hypothetical protein